MTWKRCLIVTPFLLCYLMIGAGSIEGQYQQPWSSQAYYGYNHFSSGMIWDDRVLQRQLELTKDQRRQLIEIKLDFDDEMGDMQLQVQKLTSKQYTYKPNGAYEINKDVQKQIQELQSQMAKVRSDFRARGDEILLPHQRKIRGQIQLKKLVASGFIRQMGGGSLDHHLGIKPEQRKKISARKKELEQELKHKIADLLDDFKEELIRELDAEQRDRVRELLEDYEYRVEKNTYSILNYEAYYFKKKKSPKKD